MLIGQTIGSPAKGEFYIEKELGSGAMGTVYRATLTKQDKKLPVALKIVSLGLVGNESAMARFEREAAILQQLRHPHIVRLYGTGKYRGTPYIAMEYIDGEALDRALIRRGRMGWEEVFGYGKQLCEALQHAHEKGIIHRDLKPSNLMITKDGKMKLADFGIAKDTDVTALTGANSTIGTAAYMSPEQCRGSRELSAKSDLYSLGVVFYELITGKKPFYAETTMDMFLKHVNETPVRPSKFVHDLPIWVDNLIMHLMEKSVDTRPLDAATVGRMIGEIETKVQSLQSAGLEVATARRIDRKLNTDADKTDEDKEAARALKGKTGTRKKKKKTIPLMQQTWVKGVAFGVPLLAILGIVVWLMWPVGPEKAFEQVAAATGEEKKTKVLEFLGKFGNSGHAKVEEARGIFKELHTKKIEATLYNRIGGKDSKFNRRKAQDGEDQAVMDRIWLALEAEEEGNINRARESWQFVAKEIPEADVNKYADEDAMRIPPYRWVAERHLNEIKAVGTELQRLTTAYEAALVDEKFPGQNPDALALKAMRYEKLADTANAKLTWDDLRKIVASDTDKLRWVLLASDRKLANTNDKLTAKDAATSRKITLDGLIKQLGTDWAELKGNTQKPLELRNFRNACRQITELYSGDSDLTTQVNQAAALLKEAEGK
jgi:eukaryotic-like serine/threonine-protein kinase